MLSIIIFVIFVPGYSALTLGQFIILGYSALTLVSLSYLGILLYHWPVYHTWVFCSKHCPVYHTWVFCSNIGSVYHTWVFCSNIGSVYHTTVTYQLYHISNKMVSSMQYHEHLSEFIIYFTNSTSLTTISIIQYQHTTSGTHHSVFPLYYKLY